jgi:hypothetical protein
MLTCKTDNCLMGDEEHTPHPEGVAVYCCFCGQVMSAND